MNFTFKSITGRFVLFYAVVGIVVLALLVYLVVESAGSKQASGRLERVQYPVTSGLVRIANQTNYYIASLLQNVTIKDTLGWHRQEGLSERLAEDIAFIKKNRQVFPEEYQGAVDSIETGVNTVENTVRIINRWVIDNYLMGSSDSLFLAGLPSRAEIELVPLVASLGEASQQLNRVLDGLRRTSDFTMEAELKSLHEMGTWATWIGLVTGVMVIVVSLIGSLMLLRRFSTSMAAPLNLLAKLVAGETPDYVKPTEDEFGTIVDSVNGLSKNLQTASHFAQRIGEGDVNTPFHAVSENDLLGNSLIQMRDKLREINEADKKQNWATEGQAIFAGIMRQFSDSKELYDHIISDLVKYTHSNQGGMFITQRDEEGNEYLHLASCYAYERKKYIERRMGLDEGLVGQCYQEGNTIFMRQIPKHYLHITSGLGGSNPRNLVLVPLKVNDQIEGVIELATFTEYAPHEIVFMEKVAEIIASAISNTRMNEQTRTLLHEAQQGAEQMRAQEEEMRQNMEEMQATQEQMHRQAEETKKMQNRLEREKAMFHVLMDFLPDSIVYKDKQGTITRVNNAMARKLNLPIHELEGKTDFDLYDQAHAEKAQKQERGILRSGLPHRDDEEKIIFNGTGEITWASTSRLPFTNDHNEIAGLFVVTKDISDLKIAQSSLRDRERIIERLLDNMPVFRYTITREGRLQNLWKSSTLNNLDLNMLADQPVKEWMPEVYDRITSADDEDTDLVCKDFLELVEGEKEVFQHYVYRDNAYDKVFFGFALKQ